MPSMLQAHVLDHLCMAETVGVSATVEMERLLCTTPHLSHLGTENQ